jgi:hypothetical protein
MKANSKLVAVAASLILALASDSAVFAKGHDQGVADGKIKPGDSFGGVSPWGGAAVSRLNSGGKRGSLASGKGRDNAVASIGDQSENAPRGKNAPGRNSDR